MQKIKFKDRSDAWDFIQEIETQRKGKHKPAYSVENSTGTVLIGNLALLTPDELELAKQMGGEINS